MPSTSLQMPSLSMKPSNLFMLLFFSVVGVATATAFLVLNTGANAQGMGAPVPASVAYVHRVASSVPADLRQDFDACMQGAIARSSDGEAPLMRSTVDDCETFARSAQEDRQVAQARAQVQAKYLAALQ